VAPTALVEIAYSSLGRFKQATNCAALDAVLVVAESSPKRKVVYGDAVGLDAFIAAEEPKLKRAR
jgi:hypothetical protein